MNWSLPTRCLIAFMMLLTFTMPASAQKLQIYCEDVRTLQFKTPDRSLTGLVVEVVQEIQKRVGNSDPIKMVPWARGLKYLNEEPNTVTAVRLKSE